RRRRYAVEERLEVIHTDPADAPRGITPPRYERQRPRTLAVLALLLAALAGVAGYFWWQSNRDVRVAEMEDATPPPSLPRSPAPTAPAIAHPLGPSSADQASAQPPAPLPALADGDSPFH